MVFLCFKVLSRNLPGGTEENHGKHVRIAGFRAKNQIWDLLSMNQEC
jgi:hypothetical protein